MKKSIKLRRLREDIEQIASTRTQQFVMVGIVMLLLLAVINAVTLQTTIFIPCQYVSLP